MASKHTLGASDLLLKLGRPGFPKGMVVLLVGGAAEERQEFEEQMSKLCYNVVSCESCSEARQQLGARGAAAFDIILAEASLVVKDSREGQLLLEASNSLPLVLLSSPETTTECVWRGIEVGAADVLEKPLSLLKLQNIWQHVVRKAMDQQGQGGGARVLKAPSRAEDTSLLQVDASPPASRCTLSSSLSAATNAHLPERKSLAEPEISFSESLEGKEASADVSMSNTSPENSYTVDSSTGFNNLPRITADDKPAKKARRSRDSLSEPSSQIGGLRSCSSQTLPVQMGQPTVIGMVHPSWASSQPGTQAFRGSVPPGCVWGTPLNPPPGWQGMFPNGSGPLLGSATNHCCISRCHSAPVQKAESVSANLPAFDGLADIEVPLMEDFSDDLLLSDDFLACGDNFLESLPAHVRGPLASEPPRSHPGHPHALHLPLAEGAPPPLGLKLRKSESLLDLINAQLRQSRARP